MGVFRPSGEGIAPLGQTEAKATHPQKSLILPVLPFSRSVSRMPERSSREDDDDDDDARKN